MYAPGRCRQRAQPTGRFASAISAPGNRENQPGSSSPRPVRPAASFAPRSRECPLVFSLPISPRALPECSASSERSPSASIAPVSVAAAGPGAAPAVSDAAAVAAGSTADDDAAWTPSAACARDTRGSWPESSSPPCWPSSRRPPRSGSAT